MKYIFPFLLPFFYTLVVFGAKEDECPAPPFKVQAQTVLNMMGFMDPCTFDALRACDVGCHSDFVQATLDTEKSLVEALQYMKKAADDLRNFTSCLKLNDIISSGNYTKDCTALKELGDEQSGIVTIYPRGCCLEGQSISVSCDQELDGGGWTLIQNRNSSSYPHEDFSRPWIEYVNGFGDLDKEFWLGLESIHDLTQLGRTELRINMVNRYGVVFSSYDDFKVGDESTHYQLMSLGQYSGNAGDSLTETHLNKRFSTYDNEDDSSSKNCASDHNVGWWYSNVYYQDCFTTNLNAQYTGGSHGYYDTHEQGPVWYTSERVLRGVQMLTAVLKNLYNIPLTE